MPSFSKPSKSPREGLSAHRVDLPSRTPQFHPQVLRSAPTGFRELSIPAADRGPLTANTKTLLFPLVYNDRAATIAVTVNEKGRLVGAYVGGALATVVSGRILLAKNNPTLRGAGYERWRMSEETESAATKTLGENLADMRCAGAAVAKTVLESLDYPW